MFVAMFYWLWRVRSRRPVQTAVVVLLLAAFSQTANAQERLMLFTWVDRQPRIVEVDGSVSGFGRVLAVTPVPLAALPERPLDAFQEWPAAVSLPGARFLVWRGGDGLYVFDRRQRTLINATGVLPAGVVLGGALAIDSHRPRAFVAGYDHFFQGAGLWSIDATTGSSTRLASSPVVIAKVAYAHGTDEVWYTDGRFEQGQRVTWVAAVNASTGQETRRWKVQGVVDQLLVDASGSFVWIGGIGVGPLQARDAATGHLIASSDQFAARLTTIDEARRLLLARQGDFLVAVDPLTLVELGRTRVSFTPPDPVVRRISQLLPGRWMTGAYTLRTESSERVIRLGRTGRFDVIEFRCQAMTIDAVNPDGTRRASVDVLDTIGAGGAVVAEREYRQYCWASGTVVRSPLAPTGLAAAISGSSVSLQWNDPGDSTDFELEFGFAPGQRAGTLRVGPTTAITIPGVPAGTYYVRVKAINEIGPSPPSNEIRVVVP
ncbi:MAG: fibronectin type III domain-containing protein [Acidobacteriota bacterium]|nr:fibronectin type III domain-containing protein [Acidobacteriota bacterium]